MGQIIMKTRFLLIGNQFCRLFRDQLEHRRVGEAKSMYERPGFAAEVTAKLSHSSRQYPVVVPFAQEMQV